MELTEENKINTPFFQIDESDANDIRAALNTEYENVKWKTDIHNTTLNNTELYKRAQEEDKLRRNAIDSNTESKDFSNVFKDLLTDTHIKSSEPQNTKIVTPPQYSDLADYKKLTKYQQKKTSDSQDERNRNALLDLQAERTENTPYVNSLKNRIIITQLSIDTKFRKDYFSTDAYNYTINLATPLKNVISMRLASMEIPNVQQVVSATGGTNSMVVSHSGFNKLITIPSGNYEYWLLADVLNAPIDPNEGNTAQTYIGGGMNEFDLHISIDQATQKTTIKSIKRSTDGVDLPVDFVLDFTNRVDENAPPMKTLGWILGFRKRKYDQIHFGGTFDSALYVALSLGFKKIHLIGFDAFTLKESVNSRWFESSDNLKIYDILNSKINRNIELHQSLKEAIKYSEITTYLCKGQEPISEQIKTIFLNIKYEDLKKIDIFSEEIDDEKCKFLIDKYSKRLLQDFIDKYY